MHLHWNDLRRSFLSEFEATSHLRASSASVIYALKEKPSNSSPPTQEKTILKDNHEIEVSHSQHLTVRLQKCMHLPV